MIVHLSLMIFIILINLIPTKFVDRKKIILPISFLLIAFYFAVRYNYGLDFWHYYDAYNSSREDYFDNEVLFFRFLHVFPYYYQFIICYSIILIGSLFYFVNKYVKENFYAVFFFLFFTLNGMSFNMISALRSTMAACIIWWGMELFYFKRRRILLFLATVLLAYFFHNSSLVFVVFPVLMFVVERIDWRIAFFVLIIANIASMFSSIDLFEVLARSSDYYNYSGYVETIENATFFGFLYKSLWFVPSFLILKNKNLFDTAPLKAIYSLSYIYFFLFFFGLTFQERFTVYLFIFSIIALSVIFQKIQKNEKLLLMTTMIVFCVYGLYTFYGMMERYLHGRYSEGNYLFYHTIFEQDLI